MFFFRCFLDPALASLVLVSGTRIPTEPLSCDQAIWYSGERGSPSVGPFFFFRFKSSFWIHWNRDRSHGRWDLSVFVSWRFRGEVLLWEGLKMSRETSGGFSPRFFLGQNGLHFVDDIVNDLAAPFAPGQDSALTYHWLWSPETSESAFRITWW